MPQPSLLNECARAAIDFSLIAEKDGKITPDEYAQILRVINGQELKQKDDKYHNDIRRGL